MRDPNEAELDHLLRNGAVGSKNFVDWFMKKVISKLTPSLTFLVGLTRN